MSSWPRDPAVAGYPGRRMVVDGLVAGAVAGVLSGLPSTVLAARHRTDLLQATRAAGTLLGRPTLVRGLLAHTGISLGWGLALSGLRSSLSPRLDQADNGPPGPASVAALGAAAGAGIAAVDLLLVGRRFPAVHDLAQVPQWLDHLAFGVAVSLVLGRRRSAWCRRGPDREATPAWSGPQPGR